MHVGVAWDSDESQRLAEEKVIRRKKPLLFKCSKTEATLLPLFFTVFTFPISPTSFPSSPSSYSSSNSSSTQQE